MALDCSMGCLSGSAGLGRGEGLAFLRHCRRFGYCSGTAAAATPANCGHCTRERLMFAQGRPWRWLTPTDDSSYRARGESSRRGSASSLEANRLLHQGLAECDCLSGGRAFGVTVQAFARERVRRPSIASHNPTAPSPEEKCHL